MTESVSIPDNGIAKDMKEVNEMNTVLDATEIVIDMEAYTNIDDYDSLTADDTIIVDGWISLAELEALVTVFKSKIKSS